MRFPIRAIAVLALCAAFAGSPAALAKPATCAPAKLEKALAKIGGGIGKAKTEADAAKRLSESVPALREIVASALTIKSGADVSVRLACASVGLSAADSLLAAGPVAATEAAEDEAKIDQLVRDGRSVCATASADPIGPDGRRCGIVKYVAATWTQQSLANRLQRIADTPQAGFDAATRATLGADLASEAGAVRSGWAALRTPDPRLKPQAQAEIAALVEARLPAIACKILVKSATLEGRPPASDAHDAAVAFAGASHGFAAAASEALALPTDPDGGCAADAGAKQCVAARYGALFKACAEGVWKAKP